jgi:TetR/AcrR family transcriptional regulator
MSNSMSALGNKRGRAHDAEGTREAILDAAENVFAEHGFDGARIDAIAAAADYNKSLIFHYFGDKLGLYAAVIRRADQQMNQGLGQTLVLLQEEDTFSDAHKFKTMLKALINASFDYLVKNPHFMRIFNWEMAEGWQTYAKIISQRDREDVDRFAPFFRKAQSAGLLRPNFEPIIQFVLASFLCQQYLGSIPLYQMLLPGEDFSSSAALARAREYIVEFVIQGMLVENAEKHNEPDTRS